MGYNPKINHLLTNVYLNNEHASFEPIYKKVAKKMKEEGRVVTLSKEDTFYIDNQLAMGLAPIKEEFYRKERASRYYASKLESTTAEV